MQCKHAAIPAIRLQPIFQICVPTGQSHSASHMRFRSNIHVHLGNNVVWLGRLGRAHLDRHVKVGPVDQYQNPPPHPNSFRKLTMHGSDAKT